MEGKTIKLKLQSLQITQKDLAIKLGITAQSVNAILSAKDVRSSSIEKIAQAIQKPVSFFYDEENANNIGTAIASGNYSAASIHGDASVKTETNDLLKDRIKYLEQIIDEKERTIKILMNNK